MRWSAYLSADERRQLHDRNPGLSIDEIAILAMQRPEFAGEFADLGAEVEEYEEHGPDSPVIGAFLASPDDFPRPWVPEGSEEEFARLVVAAMLVAPADLLEQVLARLPREQPLPKLKPGVKPTVVPPKTKKRVAELRIAGKTTAAIMRETKLTKTIASRLVDDVDVALGQLRAGRY